MKNTIYCKMAAMVCILLVTLVSCGSEEYIPVQDAWAWQDIVEEEVLAELEAYEEEEVDLWADTPDFDYVTPPPLTDIWPVPIRMEASTIAAGGSASFVVQPDGRLWGWGYNIFAFEPGSERRIPYFWPEHMYNDVKAVETTLGESVLIIKDDGSLWAWGWAGLLAAGGGERGFEPVHIMDDVKAVSAGMWHFMAITTDGRLWGWGSNIYGQVGDGTSEFRGSPTFVMDNVAAVSSGIAHNFAITNDGVLYGWGRNFDGRLGDGTMETQYYPVRIMDYVVQVSASMNWDWEAVGRVHTMAVRADGSLWGWGANFAFQLGDGIQIRRTYPVRVKEGVASVSTGEAHTLVILEDNSLWGWGASGGAMFGNPAQVGSISEPVWIKDNVKDVVVGIDLQGSHHNMALTTNGELWLWGSNRIGQIGDGDLPTRPTAPVQIVLEVWDY